nr:Chain C, LPEP peptide from EBV, P9A, LPEPLPQGALTAY [synthetic construct]
LPEPLPQGALTAY